MCVSVLNRRERFLHLQALESGSRPMLEWCSRQANRQKHLTWVLQYDLDHFHELRPNISFDILIHLRVFHFYPSFYHSSFINAFIKLVILTISLNILKWRRRRVSPSKATAASLQLQGKSFRSLMIPGLPPGLLTEPAYRFSLEHVFMDSHAMTGFHLPGRHGWHSP